ncbi:MAG: DUF1573 domain-containing protein [Bacteroidetes bacterium]|nr:DUF1573 domain-containing protein [Bacteroidota bacterium]
MKYTYLIVAAFLTFAACKNETKKEGSSESTEATATPTENNSGEPIDPNDVVKNNHSANSSSTPAASSSNEAAITFEMKDKDFGTINEGEQVEVSYKFKNTGGADLVISHCQAGCGCTVPIWPKDPIRPGQSGVIKAKFDSNSRPGHNEKHVTVMSNATEASVELVFHGEVKPKY